MRIRLQNPRGEVPRIDPLLLPDNRAQIARNCRFGNGNVRPFRGLLRIHKPAKQSTIRTIHRWGAAAGGDRDGTISVVANTIPVQITTSTPHGLVTGDRVFIYGTGLVIDDRTYSVTVTAADRFTLDGTAAAGVSNSGRWVRENGYWFHWTNRVNAVRSPIAGDTTFRTYITGDGKPKVTYSPIAVTGESGEYPINTYDLGVPAPETAASLTLVDYTAPVQGVTLGNPVVIRSEGHRLETGDRITFADVGGTEELNGQAFEITKLDGDTFALNGVDGTGWGEYTGGGMFTQERPVESREYMTRVYVYTYVSADGEESAPSPPTEVVDVGPNMTVVVENMGTGPIAGAYNLVAKRIYRREVGSAGGAYLFVDEIPIHQETYSDAKLASELGEVLPTEDWVPPPEDLHGLISAANGTLVGFSKNMVCPSEPYAPYAYPTKYRLATQEDIVGGAAFDQFILVCTVADAYLIRGSVPAAYTMASLSINQGCVSAASIRAVGVEGAVYASPDGLIMVTPGGWRNVTEPFLSRDEWQALNPASVHGYVVDGKYIGFYDNGATRGGFILDLAADGDGWVPISVYATAGEQDPLTDSLHLVVDDRIVRWDADTLNTLTYLYRSKRFDVVTTCFAWLEVLAKSYNRLVIRLYDAGHLVHQQVMTSREPVRLPPRRWQYPEIELEGTDEWESVTLAESSEELGV